MPEIKNTIKNLFINRTDTYTVQKPTGAYERINQPITDQDIQEHLDGTKTIGTYQFNQENKIKWICFDFDGQNLTEQFEYAKRLYNKIRFEEKIKTCLLEFSGMKGFHIWVFIQPIDGASAKIWATEISDGYNVHEIFPKQTEIKTGFGNAVKIPLAKHQVSTQYSKIFNEDLTPANPEQILQILTSIDSEPKPQLPRVIIKEVVRTIIKEPSNSKIPNYVSDLINEGSNTGDRHKNAYIITKELYHCGLNKNEIISKVLEFNNNCKPPKEQNIIIGHVNYLLNNTERYLAKEIVCTKEELELIETKSKITYKDVIETYKKWLFFKQDYAIDLCLAVAISRVWTAVPIWIIMISNSGSGKSEIIKPFEDKRNPSTTETMSKLTPNTFLSGWTKKNQEGPDFAEQLSDNPKLFLTPDFAQFAKMDSDQKGEIWAQLRDLYDGFIERKAAGVAKKVSGIKLNWLICSTPIIDSELLVQQELGTRELLFRYSEKDEDTQELMDRVWDNSTKLEAMRKELALVVRAFIERKEAEGPQEIEISIEMKTKIMKLAEIVAVLRAATESDRNTGDLTNFVYQEKPTRILTQFKALFLALKNLDSEYSDDKAFLVLQEVALSSIHPVRLRILMEIMENSPISTTEIVNKLSIGYKNLTTQLMTARQLGLVEYQEIQSDTEGDYQRKKKKMWRVTEHPVIRYLSEFSGLKQRWISLYDKKFEY